MNQDSFQMKQHFQIIVCSIPYPFKESLPHLNDSNIVVICDHSSYVTTVSRHTEPPPLPLDY